MKKILLLCFCIIFVLCGCTEIDNTSQKESVTINQPDNDQVNGYRDEDYLSSDKIGWDDITFSDKINTAGLYWGNKNSKKLHLITCKSYNNTKEENKVYYNTKEEFTKRGYTPCKICNP